MLARDRNKNTVIEFAVKRDEDDYEIEEYKSKTLKPEAKTVVNFNKKPQEKPKYLEVNSVSQEEDESQEEEEETQP